jgi:replicative DNA helicase
MDTPQDNDFTANKSRKRTAVRQSTQEAYASHGKLPPQAVDLEEAVLGALMLEKDALTAVIDILSPESFYKESHQKIYEAIRSLFNKSEPIDILTVTHELKKTGELEIVGGPFYITQLTNRVASAANVEFHSRIILQKHIQRELIRISSETIKDAFEDTSDVFNLLDRAEKNLFDVAEGNIRKNYESMTELIGKAVKQIQIAATQDSGVTGVPSGFTALDRVTSGWQKSDLIILAARPGMGKTALVLALTRNAAVQFKRPVALFSLEMSSVQLVNRLISAETELPAEKLKKGTLAEHEWAQLNAKIGKLTDAPIYIDDTPALSVFELRAKCRRLKAQKNIDMIIIDYLQLMSGGSDSKGGGNREQEISTISRSLKAIAKELQVPVIALSQLSRAVETRGGDKRPQLSDLRESGAIEQDADMVMFIYRPDYYNLTEDAEGKSLQGLAQIIIAKHRNGSLEDVDLKFTAHLAKFSDLETHDFGESPYASPSSDLNSSGGNFSAIIRKSRMDDMNEEAQF